MGVFRRRNLYYLRLTKNAALPLYVFLDEQHIEWMNDIIFQHVLSDLRPHVLDKLATDNTKSRKAKIYTIQGDEYRFCYFFRNADNHSVLVKRRYYKADAASTGENMDNKGKRKSRPKDESGVKEPRKSKRKRREKQATEDEGSALGTEDSDPSCRDLAESPVPNVLDIDGTMDLDISEEEKPKPRMQLRYEDLQLGGQCLCVVVEPLPERNNAQRGPSTTIKPGFDQQPLFLPEQELHAAEDQSESAEDEGMMTFSQRLHAMGGHTTSLVDDGEDIDDDVLLGDADDAREF